MAASYMIALRSFLDVSVLHTRFVSPLALLRHYVALLSYFSGTPCLKSASLRTETLARLLGHAIS